MNVVGWKVRDQTHWETERVVGWAVDGNLANGPELWFANAGMCMAEFLALDDSGHTALQDFLRSSGIDGEEGTEV